MGRKDNIIKFNKMNVNVAFTVPNILNNLYS